MLCEEIKHKFQEMHAGDRKNDFQRIFESKNWSKKCHAKKNMSIGGIMTSSIGRVLKKSKNFEFANRIFCVFCHFRPISRPKSEKLMAYLF